MASDANRRGRWPSPSLAAEREGAGHEAMGGSDERLGGVLSIEPQPRVNWFTPVGISTRYRLACSHQRETSKGRLKWRLLPFLGGRGVFRTSAWPRKSRRV